MTKGFTLWFTGLSGSGKTTVSKGVEAELRARGLWKIELLDGDVIRTHLSRGLSFSKEDRDINIRRIAFVCHLLTRNDAIAVAAAISPYRALREDARRTIGRFVEVFCTCPLEVLIERDPKGLYRKALAGEIPNFTGVTDPYEEPEHPELMLNTDREKPGESIGKVIAHLEKLGYILPAIHRSERDPEAETALPKQPGNR